MRRMNVDVPGFVFFQGMREIFDESVDDPLHLLIFVYEVNIARDIL